MTEKNHNSRSNSISDRDVDILLDESRRSVDRKIEELHDIDDMAVKSVRVSLVVVGFLVASAGVLTGKNSPSVSAASWAYAAIGVFSLSVSTVAGVGTVVSSEFKATLTEADREDVRRALQSNTGTPALELVEINTDWSEKLDDEIAQNYGYLSVTLATLLTGMIFLLAAGIILSLQNLFSETIGGLGFGAKLVLGLLGIVTVGLASYLFIRRTKLVIQ